MAIFPTVVIDVVGLTGSLLGEHTPNLLALHRDGAARPLRTITPAVTCPVQSTFLTGLMPSEHGIVANGWYFRDLAQVWLWRQSDHLVNGEKVWETARRRDPSATCAKMFWWYNMYGSADWSVTPRPIYAADGRKIPDIYSHPSIVGDRLKSEIGEFPFFNFWGPRADIRSSEWIAEASRLVFDWELPSLTLVYLPHLDYNLQRLGPDHPGIGADLEAIDRVCGNLIAHVRSRGARVIVLSEYGVTPVRGAVHINRVLRRHGYIAVRRELGLEVLDAGASAAFAVADHQVAHVYVRNPDQTTEVKELLEKDQGVETVLDKSAQESIGIHHPRSSELVAIAKSDRWFSYYYWVDDDVAPDFARTVDIHRKPGYDPVELFLDPSLRWPRLKVTAALLKKQLGFRSLLNVVPLDAGLVKGSHGRITDTLDHGPVFMSSEKSLAGDRDVVHATHVRDLILDHLFER